MQATDAIACGQKANILYCSKGGSHNDPVAGSSKQLLTKMLFININNAKEYGAYTNIKLKVMITEWNELMVAKMKLCHVSSFTFI